MHRTHPAFHLTDGLNYGTDDILRARLKTIGAVEHRFYIDGKSSVPRDWIVYDVGGARTQRSAWVPYFDSVDAIIFIVSLSAFDQSLSEDPSVNRMQDSLRSFRELVSSKILKNVNIIVFLNKVGSSPPPPRLQPRF
jgi:guanine nucleotide-binding protein alpha-1 subunit